MQPDKEYPLIFTIEYGNPIDYVMCYLKNNMNSFCFGDVKSYEILFDEKIIIPGITMLRIDNGSILGGHYLALTKTEVEGIKSPAYSGHEGKHSISELIKKCPEWNPYQLFIPKSPEIVSLGGCRIFRTIDELEQYVEIRREGNDLTKNYLETLHQLNI